MEPKKLSEHFELDWNLFSLFARESTHGRIFSFP